MLYIYSPHFMYIAGAPACSHTPGTMCCRAWVMGWIHCFLSLLFSSPFPWMTLSQLGKVMYWCTYPAEDRSVCLIGKSAVEPEKVNTTIICSQFSFAEIFYFFHRGWSHTFTNYYCGHVLIRAHYIPAECSALCHSDIPPGDLDKQAKTNSTQ